MTVNPLTQILNEIGNELTAQILHGKDAEKVDGKKLSQQSKTLNEIILTSEISKENKSMLHKFSLTLQEGISVKSMRYEKQDLERIIANLDN